jgi:hypothetical protein
MGKQSGPEIHLEQAEANEETSHCCFSGTITSNVIGV